LTPPPALPKIAQGSGMDTKAMMDRGVAHYRKGELAEAERQYRKVLEAEPGHEGAWNNLGVIHRRRGEAWQAVECLARALRSNPRHTAALRNLGNALGDLGLREEAALLYGREADLLLDRGQTENARASYARALECTPRDENAHYGMVLALWRLGRHAEALTSLEALLARMTLTENVLRFFVEGRTEAAVVVDGRLMKFRVDPASPNLGMNACHASGKLYEERELAFCGKKVKRGAAIVDVGANAGNHLVYFAKVLDARLIVPIEPLPDAVAQLRENIALNDIRCVDASYLGKGAGARRGRFRLVKGKDTAQTALKPARDGAIEVFPLDELELAVDFIKIDVEGMELEVLEGARRLLARCHPMMMVEVQDANREPFLALLAELGYAVAWEIRHSGGYANIFVT
jgi:FkbM family methyltransferase